MSELVMRMFGLRDVVKGGQAMAERLNQSGVSNNIRVVGRGAIVVNSAADSESVTRLRKEAKKFIEYDAKAVSEAELLHRKNSDD
ncbi:MAG: hypothetical protein ACRC9O_03160 [Plesiomonas sp.]|uniref:hypothetical protein n=1 Tax=Plesiomonas sp. TaxID=2486279 RepID=UPI003F3FC93E